MLRPSSVPAAPASAVVRTARRLIAAGAGYGNVADRMLPGADDGRAGGTLFRHCRAPKTVSVIGAPMTHGQPFRGTDSAPSLLRAAGLLSALSSLGWRVHVSPDLRFDDDGPSTDGSDGSDGGIPRNCRRVGDAARRVADVVSRTIRDGNFPLVLGGDHSVSIGSLSGTLRERPDAGVLWIDAHADLNTPEESSSGNMHGMPLGLVMEDNGVDFDRYPGLEWMARETHRLRPDRLVYVGLRDVDLAERLKIKKSKIKAFTMHDVDALGIGSVMRLALAHLLDSDPSRPVHLSYDIDAVDPQYAPATGTAVRGGLTYREAHYVAEAVAASGALAGVDLVELNADLDDGRGVAGDGTGRDGGGSETVELGMQIVTSLLGKSIL